MTDAMVHKCADFQARFHPIDTILVIHTTHLQDRESYSSEMEGQNCSLREAMRGPRSGIDKYNGSV